MEHNMALDPNVISKTLKALVGDFTAEYSDTYQSIIMIEGAKPTESDFTAKYNELDAVEPLTFLREERDHRLSETDWTRMDDNGLSDSAKASWATYRQELRDITDNATSLDDVTWPTKP